MSDKKSPLVEFSQAIGAVLGVPLVLFTLINNIVQQTAISLVVAVLTGIVLSVWLAYSRKMNLAFLAIAWLSLIVVVLLGFAVWPNTMTIEGFVSDSNGEPVTNETVRFFDYRGQVYETQTNKDGFYQFVDVPTGKYKIRVRATEIQGESKGLLVRVVSQSIAVSSESGEVVAVVPTDTPTPEKSEDVSVDDVTDTPTPKPTSTFTPTPKPKNTSTPTNTPSPTPIPTPTATIDADPTVYDNFNNPDHDGSFNQGQWKIEDGTSDQFIQKDGVLMVVRESNEHGPARLIAREYHNFTLETPMFFEARLMQSPDKYIGNVQLHLGANLSDNEGGWSECDIDDGQSDCFDVWTWVKEQNYSVGQRFADYGVWHTYRIEIIPDTMTFTYYIDGQEVGSHIPVDAEKLKKARFVLRIGVFGKAVVGYIDDVRTGQIAK